VLLVLHTDAGRRSAADNCWYYRHRLQKHGMRRVLYSLEHSHGVSI